MLPKFVQWDIVTKYRQNTSQNNYPVQPVTNEGQIIQRITCVCVCVCIYIYIYRMSQEECAILRESVPCVKVYRYNPKHLCPKLNGYGDKGAKKCGLLAVPRTVPGSRDVIPVPCALSVLVYSRLKRVPRCDCTCKVLGNPKDNYDMSASVFIVQFNGFMSLTS